MIGPRVPDNMQKEYCVRNFEINSIFGHSMNCDSADWILNASNPKRLLEEDSIRQARPGLIVNANIYSFFINKIFGFFGYNDEYPKTTFIDNKNLTYEVFERYNPKIVYFSYFLLNVKILVLSFFFYFKIFKKSIFNPLHYKGWLIWFSLVLVINNIVNQFMWSPSTKLLNIFCSLFTIYFSKKLILNELNLKKIYFINILSGILTLYYAVFFLSFVIFNFLFLLFYKRKLLNICINSLLFIIPYAMWYKYITDLNQTFYFSNFTDYNFIFWIRDSYYSFGIFKTLNSIAYGYYNFFSSFLKQYFLFFIFAPIFLYFSLKKISLTFNNPTCLSSFTFIFFFWSFFVVLGHSPQNITACLIIPFVILFSEIIKINKMTKVKENLSKKIFLIIFPVYYLWSLIKFGPYS